MIDSWIQTFTGKIFHPLAARPEDVDVRDIAHALAFKCRFNGHCAVFYSVAEHSLRVSRLLESDGPKLALWGLMHDAAEAYLADLSGPIKRLFYIHQDATSPETFSHAEDRLLEIIAQALHFPPIDYEQVRSADLRLLRTEARDLMGGECESWQVDEPPLAEIIVPVSCHEAEQSFLSRFHALHRL